MLYAEHVPITRAGQQPSIRIYSNVDSHAELDKFRCRVRAPSNALLMAKRSKDREHLVLFGNPREVALRMLPTELIYLTPYDRIEWEKTRVEIMKNHPTPFLPE